MGNNIFEKFMKIIQYALASDDIQDITEEKINETINYFSKSPNYEELTDIQVQKAKKEIQSNYAMKISDDLIAISSSNSIPWYDDNKIEHKFWNRYKVMLGHIADELDKKTLNNKFINQLGNPTDSSSFKKRGLVIGDVQSGKTSTYIGLMSKCADAGYKIFIVLTGTIESLRSQTQKRVDTQFIQDNFANALTDEECDFNQSINHIKLQPSDDVPLVLVMKKNSKVLKSLSDWLDNNKKFTELPMLLIDDEADNASINTNKNGEEPTTINKSIRSILDRFKKSNYVGFTATPFANVFIDPKTDESMLGYDLFPEDFIMVLPTPDQYIGALQMFPNDSQYHSQLNFITDIDETSLDTEFFNYKHSRDWDGILPESLTGAIYTFFLANAIRDFLGDTEKPRSMLINISRYMKVQENIKFKVQEIVDICRNAIQYSLSDNLEKTLENPILNRLYNLWMNQYNDRIEYTWNDIQPILYNSIKDIEIKVINSSTKNSDKLDYVKNPSMRVITIGGMALSRGLTLEGLLVTYFYRNTCNYDVLMQMGRWFGYRNGYENIFRVWTSEQSADYYLDIAKATEQLKNDMKNMFDNNQKPKDFGIRVRKANSNLKITANNKMRNTKTVTKQKNYSSEVFETPYIYSDINIQRQNYNATIELLQNLEIQGRLSKNVPKSEIINFLRNTKFPNDKANFNSNDICNVLDENNSALEYWDIAIINGDGSFFDKFEINKVKRNHSSMEDDIINITNRGRIGGTSDGNIGLDDYQKKQIQKKFGKKNTANKWFTIERKPLLMIYFLELSNLDNSLTFENFNNSLGDICPVAIALGFPKNKDLQKSTRKENYVVNIDYDYYDDGVEE